MRIPLLVVGGTLLSWALTAPLLAQQPAESSVPSSPTPSTSAQVPQESPETPPAVDGYVWADACRSCHAAIYTAWSHSKHARTIERLSDADRSKDCIGCHVSGPRQAVMTGTTMVNASVQCECCHGPGKAHVEGAAAGTAVKMLKPNQQTCERCHNKTGPHYRGFYFAALVGLVHKTP